MFLRLTRVSGLSAEQMGAVMDGISGEFLPRLAQQPGFMGYSVFGNPDAGTGGLSSLWETRKDLLRSSKIEKELREAALAAARLTRTPIVEEYDLFAYDVPPGAPHHVITSPATR
jgi:hypothetical protein